MAFEFSVLVVANRTAASDELLDAMRVRAARGPVTFRLLVPSNRTAEGGLDAARENLDDAVTRMRDAGLDVVGQLGEADPMAAVREVWNPRDFDEVIVSTLPTHASRWLLADLPHRLERLTGVLVTHVVSTEPRKALAGAPAPEHEHHGVLTPLRVLGWGGSRGPGGRA
jgi:hypothetical protein